MRYHFLFIAFFLSVLGNVAHAATNDFDMADYCGKSAETMHAALTDTLLGNWQLTIKQSIVIMMGQASIPDTGEITQAETMMLRNGELTLEPFAALETLHLHWTDDAGWQFDGEPHLPAGTRTPGNTPLPNLAINDQDLATLTGCEVNDLPRLIGTGHNTVHGVSMNFTVRMMMVNPDLLYGFDTIPTEVNGQHLETRQTFTLERAANAF